jgi:hypothetical protein
LPEEADERGQVSERPMLIHAHAALLRGLNKSLSKRHSSGMARVKHDMCESNKAALCKSNRKDTIYTLRGTAWERHGMCKLAFTQNSDAGKRSNGQQRGTSTCVSRKSPPSQLVRDLAWLSVNPAMLNIHLHPHIALPRRTNGRSLKTFPKVMLFRNSEKIVEKSTSQIGV